ncbi:acyl-CoA binding protein [Cryphonectria parasitica EP155]|uniref:Acyl-CoA binding protein n=1 Tax=Cryphonectria parasitica (strain ATCC 38755 / EP155) TaxID=660469 RepID=A0A9P4Y5B6_CRYP1|nr:acyl-CoA binding protein [Cryphonectria parasitica EP155]KAF3766781.1 acyl-CoA binding protein [Cryphonectria parasitica EP155]
MSQEAFDKAVIDSKKLTSKPGQDDLLALYGLYKVAAGEDISKAPAPGVFDFKGKYKKEAWQKNLKELNGNDDPVPTAAAQEAAKKKYAELIEKLKKECGFDENKVPEEVGGN